MNSSSMNYVLGGLSHATWIVFTFLSGPGKRMNLKGTLPADSRRGFGVAPLGCMFRDIDARRR
ncbi:hypothetical protein [Burkholderia sp. Ac-20344]|uniref:hypothetical protein n=1 Tax=Burkholderia sp. Ac-20344 TaxID=2703890 RepID=UPI00197C6282|nr:hypothetical protein [Burkholderia sp. Ac-20344]MBN3836060.1 hypothetical protein [Burkholderia sp. Ac-20344]